jgi:hypothetical protein
MSARARASGLCEQRVDVQECCGGDLCLMRVAHVCASGTQSAIHKRVKQLPLLSSVLLKHVVMGIPYVANGDGETFGVAVARALCRKKTESVLLSNGETSDVLHDAGVPGGRRCAGRVCWRAEV